MHPVASSTLAPSRVNSREVHLFRNCYGIVSTLLPSISLDHASRMMTISALSLNPVWCIQYTMGFGRLDRAVSTKALHFPNDFFARDLSFYNTLLYLA